MTNSVLLRLLFGVAILGLLIAGTYILGFQTMWKECPPESHWVSYSGEDITTDNYFGPGTDLLDTAAHDLMKADIPSLYASSSESHRRTIRMVTWGTYPHAVAVLTISENKKGAFEANFTVVPFRWDLGDDEGVLKPAENRSWPLRPAHSKKLRKHLSADDAWRGCKDLGVGAGEADKGVFVIEESRGGRYRMLVQDAIAEAPEKYQALRRKYSEPGPNSWYWRTFELYLDVTGGGHDHFL